MNRRCGRSPACARRGRDAGGYELNVAALHQTVPALLGFLAERRLAARAAHHALGHARGRLRVVDRPPTPGGLSMAERGRHPSPATHHRPVQGIHARAGGALLVVRLPDPVGDRARHRLSRETARRSFTSRSPRGTPQSTTLTASLRRDSSLAVEAMSLDSARLALRTGRVALVITPKRFWPSAL